MRKPKQHYKLDATIGLCGRYAKIVTTVKTSVTCKDCKKLLVKQLSYGMPK